MNMMQRTFFGYYYLNLEENITPKPIQMVFIAKAHTHEEITQDVMNEQDEEGDSQLLQKI